MQEHGASQPPPFAVLGGRAETCAPRELNIVRRMPEPGAMHEHRPEHRDVDDDQRNCHRRKSKVAVHQIGEIRH